MERVVSVEGGCEGGVGVIDVDAIAKTLRWGEGSGICMHACDNDIWSLSGMHEVDKGTGVESARVMGWCDWWFAVECIQECISKRDVSRLIPSKQSSCEEAVAEGMR